MFQGLHFLHVSVSVFYEIRDRIHKTHLHLSAKSRLSVSVTRN